MSAHDPMAFIANETRLREGHIPHKIELNGRDGHYIITPDGFDVRLEIGLSFRYRRGEGVVYECTADVPDATVQLFYNGSVYGAVAWINGFVPFHASAICHDQQIYAFTGDSGAGKSTLAAGLASADMPIYADDVLLLDVRDPEHILCLPGHKTLKLWGDALALTGSTRGDQVHPDDDKYYAKARAESDAGPLRLAHLYFLTRGDALKLTPLSGSERFLALADALYRREYLEGLGLEKNHLFRLLSQLASHVQMSQFSRPFSAQTYPESVGFIAREIMKNQPIS